MSSFWETKYLNAEKSIQFIQEAHAEVLKGLHGEIETLQKQCADYALRLSLQAATTVEKEEYDKKFKKLNVEYKKRDDLINEQKKLIEERNKSIKTLEERVRTLEKKYETEIASKENALKQFKLQIDSQSLQIANLTFQLHNLRNNKQNDARSENELNSKSSKKLVRSKEDSKENESISQNSKAEKIDQPQESHFVGIPETRSNSTQSNSPRSRSITPPAQKVLPPVIKRVSEVIPPPDPKPFLLSAASTLHTRSRKDYLQRKALISLPPIKPFELNHLAVESPLKIGHKNSNLVQNCNHDQNNASS